MLKTLRKIFSQNIIKTFCFPILILGVVQKKRLSMKQRKKKSIHLSLKFRILLKKQISCKNNYPQPNGRAVQSKINQISLNHRVIFFNSKVTKTILLKNFE